MNYLFITIIALPCYVGTSTGKASKHGRQKRQEMATFTDFSSQVDTAVELPVLYQSIFQGPTLFDRIIAARCGQLTGYAAPIGSSYIALLVDTNNQLLNCQLQFAVSADTFQPSLILGQFLPPVLPDYPVDNRFLLADQSNLDRFVGVPQYFFTSSTATISIPSSPTTSTTTGSTGSTATTTATTAAMQTTTTTTPTTSTSTGTPTTDTTTVTTTCIPGAFGCGDIG